MPDTSTSSAPDSAFSPSKGSALQFPYNPPVKLGSVLFWDVNQAIREAQIGDSIFFSNGVYTQPMLVQAKEGISLIGSDAGTFVHIPEANTPVIQINSSVNINISKLFLRHDVPREACFGPGNTISAYLSENFSLRIATSMVQEFTVSLGKRLVVA